MTINIKLHGNGKGSWHTEDGRFTVTKHDAGYSRHRMGKQVTWKIVDTTGAKSLYRFSSGFTEYRGATVSADTLIEARAKIAEALGQE